MRNLIEKFYSYSPAKRLVAIISFLVFISVVSAVYSFMNLVGAVKQLNDAEWSKSTGFENLPAQKQLMYLDESTRAAFASWKTVSGFAGKLLKEPAGNKSFALAASVSEHDQEIVAAIKAFNGLDWKYLVIFASPQLDPLDCSLAESYKKIRKTAKFLAAFHARFKEQFPAENSAFIFEASIKLARMTDLSSPFLIGKMIAAAIDGIALKSLVPMVRAGLISEFEVADCLVALTNSLAIDRSMAASMEDEFVYFKYFYGALYRKAPVAMWLLDVIYGDPVLKYKQLKQQMFETGSYDEDLRVFTHHLVLLIALPNFRKAYIACQERLAQKVMLASKLALLLGKSVSLTDPWSGQPIKSVQKDGETVFYSVGPDRVDGRLTGDDISLPAVE